MNLMLKTSFAGLAAIAAVAMAPGAWACGEPALLHPSVYHEGDNRGFGGDQEAVIVGMWAVQFTAGGNQIDFGYSQWHADGTEFLNSGGRAPSTQNYCLGVWRQTGPRSFHLNHIAISYTPAGVVDAKVVIKEDVTVDGHAQNYSGPFSIDVYDPKTNALLNHVAGTVTGQRVLPN